MPYKHFDKNSSFSTFLITSYHIFRFYSITFSHNKKETKRDIQPFTVRYLSIFALHYIWYIVALFTSRLVQRCNSGRHIPAHYMITYPRLIAAWAVAALKEPSLIHIYISSNLFCNFLSKVIISILFSFL